MKRYIVKSPITFGGKLHKVGQTIRLPPEIGDPRVKRGRLERAELTVIDKPSKDDKSPPEKA